MHTEVEAKTKWCPEARALTYTKNGILPVSGNVLGDGQNGEERVVCIASECMHWRWAKKRNPDWTPGMTASYPYDPRRDVDMQIEDRTQGFCGLSGRP